MKVLAKKIGLTLLASKPVYKFLRARALDGSPVTILCYHTLRPASERFDAWVALTVSDFRAQIESLRRSHEIVSLDEALKPSACARPRAVLTFDDGERGLYDHLLPIIRDEALPVTVYVATAQIETSTPFWFDRVMNALQVDGITHIDLRAYGLGSWEIAPARGKARWRQIESVLAALKGASPRVRDELADLIAAQAGPAAKGFRPLQPMTRSELGELAAVPHVTIGAHSHGHELLDQIPLEHARASITRSRELLQEWTGRAVHHFAYPNGNYSAALMRLLEELGFASATILEDRLVTQDSHPHALPRIGIGRYDTLDRFRLRLVGV